MPTLDMTSGQPVECSPDDFNCGMDVWGHGTHVAGTAAGTRDGIATGAKVRNVKIFKDDGNTRTRWILKSHDWIAENKPTSRRSVATMSFGGGKHVAQNEAVNALVESGVVVVVSAGNDGVDACQRSPASASMAITVGATTEQDKMWWETAQNYRSNYGKCVDIFAPGQNIRSADPWSDNGRIEWSGTSMACPHVAGAAAAWLDKNPNWKPARIKNTLIARSIKGTIKGKINTFEDTKNRRLDLGGVN